KINMRDERNMKNTRKIILATALVTVLILVSAVNATDDIDNGIDNTISEKTSTQASPIVKKETTTNNSMEDKKVKEKEIQENKTDKSTKQDPVTIDGVTYSNVIENQVFDCEENLIQIEITENTFINNCIFTDDDWGRAYLENYATCYINNTKIQSDYNPISIANLETTSKMIINNSIICGLTNDGELFIYNSTLNGYESYKGDLCLYGISKTVIDELTILGPDFRVENTTYTKGTIYTNNTQVISKFEELNIPGITIVSGDGNDEENNITIENQTITEPNTNDKNTTYINCSLNSKITNYANLTLLNCTLNTTIVNKGILIIDDNCILGEGLILDNDDGEIITNDSYRLIPYMPKLKGNYTFENMIITDKIINNGNLSFINCSFSNNNMITSFSKSDGFLIENNGNMSMIGCVVENNVFNTSESQQYLWNHPICGAVANNGNLIINNCTFRNNSVGYAMITDKEEQYHYDYGVSVGDASCIYNNGGNLSINDTIFENNYAGKDAGAILSTNNYTSSHTLNSEANLYINNTRFINNTATGSGGAISIGSGEQSESIPGGECEIENCEFTDNKVLISINGGNHYGGAIKTRDATVTIHTTTFNDNTITAQSQSWGSNIGTTIGSTNRANYNITLDQCTFNTNNTGTISIDNQGTLSLTSNTINSISIKSPKIIAYNNTLNNSYINIDNNIFGQALAQIYNNTIANQSGITISNLNATNRSIHDNTYLNAGINDELTLNIPNNIYTDEPITITGQYTINNPEYYDADILEQNKFNIYINEELVETIDELEFTITPTDSNMILTVQPTISQTRRSEFLQSSTLNITLDDITATIGETTQLTAQITLITDDTPMEVNTGRVYFKVNGKILRDTDTGRILYADVTDNTATMDYLVPKTWNEETEVTAIFTGNDDLPQKTSNTVNPTITTPETSETEFTVADTTATAGSEVTITVTTKNLNDGKVVLKVNGKTVKTTDGKLYAKVIGDTTTFTYTVPKTYKAGYYDIKAVYTYGANKLGSEGKLIIE
ncbi:MAG: hypothetical protein BZ136_04870, partial [Methanosphaera sp. rholeuAM74]